MATDGISSYRTQLFINNEYVDAKSGKTLDVYNPTDESLVCKGVHIAGEADVDAAVDAAVAAFKKGPWNTYTAVQRSAVMNKFADLIESRVAEFVRLETLAMGGSYGVQSYAWGLAARCFRYYAGWTDKLAGEVYPPENGEYRMVRYEPLGVCAGIGAWNGSSMLFAWKCAPALAAGNVFIFKASEKSPLGIVALGDLIKEAGFPPGVIQIVNGAGETGGLLASHMKINKISFTGSINAGRKVQEAATKSNLKRCTLELGGKSPALVFNDCNLQNAVEKCALGVLMNSGQVCSAATRPLVQEEIAPKFIELLKQQFVGAGSTLGADPLKPETLFGPLADKAQFESVMSFIESGKSKSGGELLVGGNKVGEKGFFVSPAIFLNPDLDSDIYKKEIFGPVAAIRTFKTEEEAIELANDTTYGLSACVYTTNIAKALRVAGKLEAGTVAINNAFVPSIEVPFGGYKMSGIGRESGRHGLMAYVEVKTISIK
ncbi:putative aldehyde dehydrogenase [Eremomyces bilateralis CBS 781.70]|uniref:aldehyde dehydrogenase (NAD(+)) n=1 Tax=Eremomyces bilateralis CBS 781.70 TaxID=1392243 RepID=A0A6G1G0I3_9PEZI|nr:putative aldehyde dehydrogenase [Eremomyces bilateralis CBS 781.70]KAF1811492.1 putative aldehyde dehydrogenase [Eremomyces bilateralis CBS 781.70]